MSEEFTGVQEEIEVENKLDPRQRLTWNNYIDQTKETFGNGYRSAIAARFSDGYARRITTTPWFRDKMRRTHLLGKAEKVLDKILDANPEDETGKLKADILRVQADTAKHITKTLGKDEGYSERIEGGNNGNSIVFLPQELIEKFNLAEPKKDSPENKE